MARTHHFYDANELREVVKQYFSFADVLRHYGKTPVGGNSTNLKLFCARHDIDVSHFTGNAHARGKPSQKKRDPLTRLVRGTSLDHRAKPAQLREALELLGREYKCNVCGIDDWNGRKLTLEIDHIDECYWNNEADNLQFICPNCHSLKNTKD